MRRKLTCRSILATLALLSACGIPPPGTKRPNLSCESVRDPRLAALCRRIEPELEYAQGGHGIVFGNRAYRCTTESTRKVFCSAPRLTDEDFVALHNLWQPDGTKQQWNEPLINCLLRLRNAMDYERATVKPSRDPRYVVSCPTKAP